MEGVKIVECAMCHNDIYMSKAGKFRGSWYCDGCYMIRIDMQIQNWKIEYKRARNNKAWEDVKNNMPRLGDYIN